MWEILNKNPGLTALVALALVLIILFIGLVILGRHLSAHSRRDRSRLMQQLKHENELQSQSVAQLNQTVGDSVRQVAELSGAMETRQERIRTTLDARMELLTQQNDQKLEEMRRMVGEKLEGRLTESFRVVNSQLADVHKGIGEMRELAANVTDLKKVLGNVKTRGVWGEVQLKSLLSQMFSPEQYIENAAIPAGSQMRVEFALKLPEQGDSFALLPIDSKFPQEDYVRLVDADAAGDPVQREKCAMMLERAVLEQAKTIAEKYIRPPQTADFAVMFLPAEGLYAEAASRPGLIERIQTRNHVLIAGPSTLCALLTSLQMGFRTSALEKRSGEVLKLFDEMRTEFSQFQESIARARQRINQAEGELDQLEARARRITRKLM